MSFFAPATLPWLLRYEMKMAWRGRSRGGKYAGYILLLFIVAVGLTAGLPLAYLLRGRTIGASFSGNSGASCSRWRCSAPPCAMTAAGG